MADRMRKIVWVVVFAFVLYSIFANPRQAGHTVHDVWDSIRAGFRNIGDFFQTILDSSD